MKKLLFGALLLFAVAITATAQQGPRNGQAKERIESYRIAFFTEKLQLTPDESKDFWPLYNQFENERKALREKYNLRGKKIELMSDAEVEDYVMGQVQMAEDLAKMRRDYVYRFKEIIPIRKVAMLPEVEKEFKKVLLRELRERRQGERPQQRQRPGGN